MQTPSKFILMEVIARVVQLRTRELTKIPPQHNQQHLLLENQNQIWYLFNYAAVSVPEKRIKLKLI